jgi:phosphoribosylamine--glycine ligase/phosphoribosylaminoimidazole synthetase
MNNDKLTMNLVENVTESSLDKQLIIDDLEKSKNRLDKITAVITQNISNKELDNIPVDPLISVLTRETVYRVLVVGSGGREHAIVEALSKSQFNVEIYNTGTHSNPGITSICKKINLTQDINEIVQFAVQINVSFVIVGPEIYLEKDLVGLLHKNKIKCFGPTAELAQIETSKSFARHLMTSLNMNDNSPDYRYFTEYNEDKIKAYFKKLDNQYVIKADGLYSGKGVKVMGIDLHTEQEALDYCYNLFRNDTIFLVEEKLVGEEFSAMSFTDGTTTYHMPIVKDYKRLKNGDTGSQTGGMGSFTMENHQMPFLTDSDVKIANNINTKILKGLQDTTKAIYQGVIYGSYIKTATGIKVIEFNSRFGDPEGINILSILQTDFMEICLRVVNTALKFFDIKYRNEASMVIYSVPQGYPKTEHKHREIYTYNVQNHQNIMYASVKLHDDSDKMTLIGSRAVACIGKGPNLSTARLEALNEIKNIYGPVEHRTDIGADIISNSAIDIGYTYGNAGVSIDTNTKVVESIRELVESTHDKQVLSKHGDFSGLVNFGGGIMSISVDGTGTKSILVEQFLGVEKGYESLGYDVVNHGINDCLVSGAKPFAFLDYFASSKVDPAAVKYFVKGIRDACQPVECRIMGGETAEMPSVYIEGCSDLVGVMIGRIANKKKMIDPSKIKAGDLVYAWGSTGPHTNGYTLIRKILKDSNIMNSFNNVDKKIEDKQRQRFIKFLTSPHGSYYDEYNSYVGAGININGMVHITGGGLIENPPRILPHNLKMVLHKKRIIPGKHFDLLQQYGKITDDEMYRTFNCGVGMLIIVNESDRTKVEMVNKYREWSNYIWKIGTIMECNENESQIQIR